MGVCVVVVGCDMVVFDMFVGEIVCDMLCLDVGGDE